MELSHIVILILGALCAGLSIKVFMRKDSARVAKHKGAALMAGSFSAYGFKRIPTILTDYSQSDWVGIGKQFESIYELFMQGEDVVKAELAGVFKNVLKSTVLTDEGRAYVASVLADASKASSAPSVLSAAQSIASSLAAAAVAEGK